MPNPMLLIYAKHKRAGIIRKGPIPHSTGSKQKDKRQRAKGMHLPKAGSSEPVVGTHPHLHPP